MTRSMANQPSIRAGHTKSKNLTLFNPGGCHKHILPTEQSMTLHQKRSANMPFDCEIPLGSENPQPRPDRDQRPENRKRALADTNACRRANSCLPLRTYRRSEETHLLASGSQSYRFPNCWGTPTDQGQEFHPNPNLPPTRPVNAILTRVKTLQPPSQQRPNEFKSPKMRDSHN